MDYSGKLRERLKVNAMSLSGVNGTELESVFLFDELSMNFHPNSFKNIQENPAWWKLAQEIHRQVPGYLEMQSSNSSDALLMNIFCYGDFLKWKRPKKLLGINNGDNITIGQEYLNFPNEIHAQTKINLRIGRTIFKSRLTEGNFGEQDRGIVEKYDNLLNVFNTNLLKKTNDGKYKNYLLIRYFLVAYQENCQFILLVDESRTDLIREFYDTLAAVKYDDLRARLRFVTWQELVSTCGAELKQYIEKKYFSR
jgi:hypothetical protein